MSAFHDGPPRPAAVGLETRHALALAAARGASFDELAPLALSQIAGVLLGDGAEVALVEDGVLRWIAEGAEVVPAVPPRAWEAPPEAARVTLRAEDVVLGYLAVLPAGFARGADRVALEEIAGVLAAVRLRERGRAAMQGRVQALDARLDEARGELRRLEDEIARAGRLSGLGLLAAGVAHELVQPIHLVGGYLEVLTRGADPERQARALRSMTAAVARMGALVDRVREWSSGVGDARGPVPLDEVAAMAVELACATRPVPVRLDGAPGVVVRGDRYRLEQVVINLVTNAIQAGGEPVVVRILAPDPATAVVEVADRGPGVPPALRERIFEPFFTTRARDKGTGLGLSVSARIVQEHGGRIEVTDAEGGGALFRVVLPREV